MTTLTEKDRLIVSQVAVKGAVELAASLDGIEDVPVFIEETAQHLYELVFILAGQNTALTAPAQASAPAPAPAPVSLQEAANVVRAAFPGAEPVTQAPAPSSGVLSRAELWKHVADHPDQWWDNRTDKRNPRSPDFKAKNTGPKNAKGEPAALWVNSEDTPDWARNAYAVQAG